MMDIESIMDNLPHRYPFLLIDRVLEIVEEKSLRALKNVTINEPFFQGHFPGKKIMPGVLILEGLAQACSLLMDRKIKTSESSNNSLHLLRGLHLFRGIENAKFKRIVVPGDSLILDVTCNRVVHLSNRDNNKGGGGMYTIFDTKAYVDDEIAVTATLNLIIKP